MSKVISPFVVSARRRIRDSFTLVEILVVIAIIAILAGVALPAITGAIKKGKENAGMQTARGLGLAAMQFANDNQQVYPGGATNTTSTLIWSTELIGTYINNTDALCISGSGGGQTNYAGTLANAPGSFSASNNTWDFTVGSGGVGLSFNDPPQTPLIISTGSEITYGTANTAASATTEITNATSAVYGTDGVAIDYLGGNAAFEPSGSAAAAAAGFNITSGSFVPYQTYKQLFP